MPTNPPSPTHCTGCPYFLETPSHIKTAVGDAANLTCGVRSLGDRQVSWIRRRDLHVLTTDSFTYTTDSRFRAIHLPTSPYWILQVDDPQVNDSGIYECQVSTQPKTFKKFTLLVVEPRATIQGLGEVFMKTGSDINITCVITGATIETSPVTWYHAMPKLGKSKVEEVNSGMRGGIQLITDRMTGYSWLLVANATWRDAGIYTCSPRDAIPASITVHLLDDEIPAAMQGDVQPSGSPDGSSSTASSASSCLLLSFTSLHLLLSIVYFMQVFTTLVFHLSFSKVNFPRNPGIHSELSP
ncbi:hemicentin-1-like [Palaemon carinicauda]|uniref:hemicentin-1-like n=1 Tax=Palaemon carinicauda TaxID=392227 RepID=UPI0035B58904